MCDFKNSVLTWNKKKVNNFLPVSCKIEKENVCWGSLQGNGVNYNYIIIITISSWSKEDTAID